MAGVGATADAAAVVWGIARPDRAIRVLVCELWVHQRIKEYIVLYKGVAVAGVGGFDMCTLHLGESARTLVRAGLVLALVAPAAANPEYVTPFNTAYPGNTLSSRMAASTGSACNVCHHPTNRSTRGNCYRLALQARLNAGRTITQAIADINDLDSDNDGTSNGDEILMARADLPGQVGYSPGLVGPTGTDPCGTNPIAAVTNTSETPPAPPCAADFNGAGGLTVQDIFDFLAAYFAGEPSADFNGVGGLSVQDIFEFLAAYFAGC